MRLPWPLALSFLVACGDSPQGLATDSSPSQACDACGSGWDRGADRCGAEFERCGDAARDIDGLADCSEAQGRCMRGVEESAGDCLEACGRSGASAHQNCRGYCWEDDGHCDSQALRASESCYGSCTSQGCTEGCSTWLKHELSECSDILLKECLPAC